MEQKYNTVFESIGIYLPPKVVSTKEILQGCKRKVRFPMERMTGIKSRRMAGETEFSIDLAKKAVEDCLANSKYSPEHVELLICCNISRYDAPDQFSAEPCTAVKLKKYFGFNNAIVFDITNACTGMWTGVKIVDVFIKLGIIRCGMVVSGEYITHLTLTAQKEVKGFMDQRLACLTLGDAGAAITLEGSSNPGVGLQEIDIYTLGRYSPYCIAKPTDKEHGGAIMLTESIKLTAVSLKYAIMHTEYLRKLIGWQPEDFQHLITHQVSKLAIDDAVRQINRFYNKKVLHKENVVNNLSERGNTASTSHVVALKEFILNNRIKSGDNLLISITGSGLTVGVAFYTLDDLPDRILQMEASKRTPHKLPIQQTKTDVPHLSTPIVRIESVGTIEKGREVKRDSLELVKIAAEDCLEKSSYNRSDIDLLVYTGVYRSDLIFEPAIASMITGSLKINHIINSPEEKKTLAFDIFNGAVGFLNACYVASKMIQAKKYKNAMIVTAEIENNRENFPEELYGLEETGSVLILDEAPDQKSGFGNFIFKYFTDYLDTIKVNGDLRGKKPYLDIYKDPAVYDYYIECIHGTIQELLRSRGLNISQIKVIFPPQISSQFISKLSDKMNITKDKFIDATGNGKDFFTSSIPYALQYAKEHNLVNEGDIGLIVSVGSGIQVGCATYYF
jgi:3-oxoacyl-[acyl-carrier-protein] synthase III